MGFDMAGALDEVFQHTAARRRLAKQTATLSLIWRFNTQPPEGGWEVVFTKDGEKVWFQHTAARRRLGANDYNIAVAEVFQHTAARRRLALIFL